MPDKVYCIVKEGDHLYIPVKAEKNPYVEGKDAYLKNLPNFFGGTVDKLEYRGGRIVKQTPRTPEDALSAEIFEESRKNIQIDRNTIAGQRGTGKFLEAQVGGELYWFGLINVQENPAHPIVAQGRLLNFIVPSRDRAENEMRYLLKVTVDSIIQGILPADADALYTLPIDQINPEVIDKMANKILSACSMSFSGGNSSHFADILKNDKDLKVQWDTSETKKAFAILVAVLYRERTENA